MKTLLYVDDSSDDLLLFQTICQLAGPAFHLRVAAGGPQAIAYLAGNGAYATRAEHPLPDFILLDLKMPEQDGFDVLRWVRTNASTRRTAVAMYSASMIREDVTRAYAEGADSFLTKRADINEVMEIVRAIDACLATEPVNCGPLAQYAEPR